MPFPSISTTQQFLASINPVDKKGKPAPIDGEPTWGASDPAVVSVVPNPGGLSALVVAQGVGTYTVSVSADADLGAGVVTITATDTGDVVLGQATAINFVVGPVEEQP